MAQMWQARRGCYLAAGKYRQETDATKKGDSVRDSIAGPTTLLSTLLSPLSRLSSPLARTNATQHGLG